MQNWYLIDRIIGEVIHDNGILLQVIITLKDVAK